MAVSTGFGITLDDDTDTRTTSNNGDHDRFSHYVRKEDSTRALVEGTPIVALCGKVWVPSRDPKNFPICPECKEIYDSLPKE